MQLENKIPSPVIAITLTTAVAMWAVSFIPHLPHSDGTAQRVLAILLAALGLAMAMRSSNFRFGVLPDYSRLSKGLGSDVDKADLDLMIRAIPFLECTKLHKEVLKGTFVRRKCSSKLLHRSS